MNSNDDDLKEFFAALRKEDEASVPEFHTGRPEKSSRKLVFAVLSAAASILIAVFFFTNGEKEKGSQPPLELVISLPMEKTVSSGSLLSDESMDAWKPSSDFLLNDF